MGELTQTDAYADRAPQARSLRRHAVLIVAFRANQPYAVPSRHSLDEIDAVVFGRGVRSAVRDEAGGLRRLVLRIPDPIMSAEHGRLLFAHGQWLLEDPRSKNGTVVEGRPTRAATIAPGTIFELGHTLFLLEMMDVPVDLPRDAAPAELSPGVTTLSPAFAHALALLARVARADVPVLLLGETGTGKEVLARALHDLSGRRGPCVAVNCGALAPSLVEAELFGHKRGAFSGAVSDRPGYLRTSDHGTLFLDEIGELPATAQVTLLRALQQREVVPVGDSVPVSVDIRVCAATNRDLPALVAAGSFREDLYARLLGVTVTLPPLRDRRCDVGLLIASILRGLPGGDRCRFTPTAAYALFRYAWPLNVRELERCLAAALAFAAGAAIAPEHLPAAVAEPGAGPARTDRGSAADDEEAGLREKLVELLRTHEGNVAGVAREVGKHREQVHRWLRRFGIDPDSFRR